MEIIVMWLGFTLAAFSVVGNDVIQTLGTFLTSNEEKLKWYVLWAYAATILTAALVMGYVNSDISYGRLDKFEASLATLDYAWYYLLPPIILLTITRFGIPVSTTFMILTLFSLNNIPDDLGAMVNTIFNRDALLGGMIFKSLMGYILAFGTAIVVYLAISRITENYFLRNPIDRKNEKYWVVVQWVTTGFLWFQWLTQDLANIYVYLRGGEGLSLTGFVVSLMIILGLLALIFYLRGGRVQNVVREKINTVDIRSATFIDFIYGVILYVFKYDYFGLWGGKLPMSTTWIFVGLLAGREFAIRMNLKSMNKGTLKMVGSDLLKITTGLVVSVVLVFVIKMVS